MENKEHQIWFDIFMYTLLLICITYLIFLNQMQRYFIYTVVIGYIVAIIFKLITLRQIKQHKNFKNSN